MSENKNDLRKLVKIIVFILAFAVSGVASLGVLGLAIGATTSVVGLLMGGVVSSIGAVGNVASLLPKLFEKSAKAKAQEIEPAARTWLKLQQAYMMETSEIGDCKQIGYTTPGNGRTENFTYDCGIDRGLAYWVAKSNNYLDECPAGSQWYLLIKSGDDEPEVFLPENKSCQDLTPNFSKLKSEQDKSAKEKKARQAEEAAKQAAEQAAQEAEKRAAEEEAARLANEEAERIRKAEEEAESIMKGLDF